MSVMEDWPMSDDEYMHEYKEGFISFEALPEHLQWKIEDDYLWEQADAMYDMMQEEDY